MTPELAIENNHHWYVSIFRAHGLASRIDEHYWSTDAQPPPYHSCLVTRTRGPRAREAQLERLAELRARAGDRLGGCKDSFDELPAAALERLGMRTLFRACWYGWASAGSGAESETRLEAWRVESPEALASWESTWRRSSPAGEARVFPEAVLADQGVELWWMTRGSAVAGGFALNRSAGSMGLSNVFQCDEAGIDPDAFVRECARAARRLDSDRPIVGYGPPSELSALSRLGFVELGPLRVWALA